MKTAILALCLLGAAFAAPINEYIDPDCIEEDIAFEEPISDIDAEFALGVPDLTIGVGGSDNNDEECEDDMMTEAPVAAPEPVSDECVDDLPAYEAPEYEPTTEAGPEETTGEELCEDDPIETEAPTAGHQATTAEDCVETEPTESIPAMNPVDLGDECDDDNNEGAMNEGVPQLDIRIEPAMANFDAQIASDYGGEQEVEPIEECEEY